jgi:hypothetical protein
MTLALLLLLMGLDQIPAPETVKPLVEIVRDEKTGDVTRRFNFYAHQKLGAKLAETYPIVCMAGSVQNGKSIWGIWQLGNYITRVNPSPGPEVERVIWIAIPDRKKYWAALKPKIEYVFGHVEDGGLIVDHNKAEPSYELLATDGGPNWKLNIVSLKDPDTARSATICACLISEAGKCHEQSYDNILARLAMRNGPLFLESSPFGLNWFWHRVVNNASITYSDGGRGKAIGNPMGDKRIAVIRGVKIEDNLAMARSQIELLRAGTGTENAKREYDGEFFQWSGLIWKKFRPLRQHMGGHLIDPPRPEDFTLDGKYGAGWTFFGGMDFGFDHPFAHIWIARRGRSRIVLSCYRDSGETLSTHADRIKANRWNKYVEYRYADPSAAQARADIDEFGVPSDDAKNDVEPGIDCVARLFEQGDLLISAGEDCADLVDEIGNYHRDEKTGRPVKVDEDLCDALRYACYTDDLSGGTPLPHYSTDDTGTMRLQADTAEALEKYRELIVEDADEGADAGKEIV